MTRAWIGDPANLRPGDVITGWSKAEGGGITLQVHRNDPDTAKAVLDFMSEALRQRDIWGADGIYDILSNARRHFDAGSQEPLVKDDD